MLGAYKGPFSEVSLFSVRLEVYSQGQDLGSGTGFFYLPPASDTLYLVTNYHVVTASDPGTPDVLMKGIKARPEEIRYRLLSRPDLALVTGSIDLTAITFLEHPRRADGVDIAAVPVTPPSDGLFLTQGSLGLVEDIELMVGGELFIVGFPFGIGAGDFLPIWKRGTIASEPNFQPNGLNMFYIDATTKPGMSGSPVFAAESRDFLKLDDEASRAFAEWERGEREPMDVIKLLQGKEPPAVRKRELRLVGVYSGRLTTHRGEDTQVGIVWKRELLDEMFQGK